MPKDLPSPELLRKLLRYEPDTGKLFWRERPVDMFTSSGARSAQHNAAAWNSKHSGREAFTGGSHGYRCGRIFDITYPAHRVAWALHVGEWPKAHIDHINGVRNDNRISNLRDVARKENQKNLKKRVDNASGVVGVYWASREGKWCAEINVDSRKIHLGYFEKMCDASAARKCADRKYNFHQNHGCR